jgi:hypothetical protein
MIAAILKRSLATRDGIGRQGALVPDFRTHVWRDHLKIEFTTLSRNLKRHASDVAVFLGLYSGRNFYTHFLYGNPKNGQIAANQS